MNKIVNLTVEDQVMWLVNIQTQLISSLEEAQRQYKENANEYRKEQPSLALMTKHQDNSTFNKIGLPNIWSLHYHETNQCCGLPTQTSKLHESPSCVSYFFIGTLPCINHPKKDL
jgi:hypothetical protein